MCSEHIYLELSVLDFWLYSKLSCLLLFPILYIGINNNANKSETWFQLAWKILQFKNVNFCLIKGNNFYSTILMFLSYARLLNCYKLFFVNIKWLKSSNALMEKAIEIEWTKGVCRSLNSCCWSQLQYRISDWLCCLILYFTS